MKRLAMYLALCLGCYGPTFGILAQPVVPPHNSQETFEYACKLGEYDCSQLAPPRIAWVWNLTANGAPAFGAYNGGDVIYMSAGELRFADPVFTNSILAHETAHYIDVQLGLTVLPFTYENVCASEMRAWRIGNAYVITHGRPDLADFSWHERYGCFL